MEALSGELAIFFRMPVLLVRHCLFKREGLPVEVLDQLHWRIRRLPLSSRWRLIAAISSGQQLLETPPAMEAVGLGD
jgi:hypothetical protein